MGTETPRPRPELGVSHCTQRHMGGNLTRNGQELCLESTSMMKKCVRYAHGANALRLTKCKDGHYVLRVHLAISVLAAYSPTKSSQK